MFIEERLKLSNLQTYFNPQTLHEINIILAPTKTFTMVLAKCLRGQKKKKKKKKEKKKKKKEKKKAWEIFVSIKENWELQYIL